MLTPIRVDDEPPVCLDVPGPATTRAPSKLLKLLLRIVLHYSMRLCGAPRIDKHPNPAESFLSVRSFSSFLHP